jgi:hypothetical protein
MSINNPTVWIMLMVNNILIIKETNQHHFSFDALSVCLSVMEEEEISTAESIQTGLFFFNINGLLILALKDPDITINAELWNPLRHLYHHQESVMACSPGVS